MKTISRDDLQQLLGSPQPPVLLEALPERYYRDGRIPGARHFPHDQVDQRAGSLIPDKNSCVVVYCASDTCKNSHLAAEALTRLGYEAVSVYVGGKKDWSAAGLPLERE
jgi:rhodanese-related sulfurtransferase